MVDAYHEMHHTVLNRFGGSICGEHGDGRIRAEYVRKMFGEELYDLFVQVKHIFDPSGVLNPGIKISEASFTEHIDYTRLSKSCATCAKCNSVCPVYDVFQSEDMSSRGWFEIVTAKDYSYLDSKRVVEACLNCKSCRTICPAGVDVSDLILKRRAEHPNRVAGGCFGSMPVLEYLNRSLNFGQNTAMVGSTDDLAAGSRGSRSRFSAASRKPRSFRLKWPPKLAVKHLRDRYPALVERAIARSGRSRLFPRLRRKLLRRWSRGCGDRRSPETWH